MKKAFYALKRAVWVILLLVARYNCCGQTMQEAIEKMSGVFRVVTEKTLPEVLFDSTDIQLGRFSFLKLKVRRDGPMWPRDWKSEDGELFLELGGWQSLRLEDSFVEWRYQKGHPERGVAATLLRNYRKDEDNIFKTSHHEDLKANWRILFDFKVNLLGERFATTRSTFNWHWGRGSRPRANFWEVDIKTIAGKKIQGHIREFLEVLTDSLRANMEILNYSYIKKVQERQHFYFNESNTQAGMPFILSDRNRKHLPKKRWEGKEFNIQGRWKAKFILSLYNGKLGRYLMWVAWDFNEKGEVDFCDWKVCESYIQRWFSEKSAEENLMEAFAEWRALYKVDEIKYSLKPSEDPRFDYYLSFFNLSKSFFMSCPVYISSRQKIFLISISSHGDPIAIPLQRYYSSKRALPLNAIDNNRQDDSHF